MIVNYKTSAGCCFPLPLFNVGVNKFEYFSAINVDHVINGGRYRLVYTLLDRLQTYVELPDQLIQTVLEQGKRLRGRFSDSLQ